MTYYRVVTGDNAWIDRFETVEEARECSDQNPGSWVEEFPGEMPEKLTVERVREMVEELQQDTPENRARQALISDFLERHPAIARLRDTDSEGGCTD